MLENASRYRSYSYYHLLSGVDLPLKSNDFIHHFFQKNDGKNFIGFASNNETQKELYKVLKYHFFVDHLRTKKVLFHFLYISLYGLQKILCYNRKRKYNYKKGAEWFSITNEFAMYIISRSEQILNDYKFTLCPDEIFMQTEIWNSVYVNTIFNLDDQFIGCMRQIDWIRGHPYIWTENNYDELMSSDFIFARKFDISHINVVYRIAEELKRNKSK